ncbi:hypothetical protein [Nocardia sp. MH4]|uniref:hypothetical protein n=1 Tax=Nocardia sp. MH4 TaxID=1768677 RepID=UPI001C4E8C15|nr:hypothetical protein [Nocardia sp. MH4]
MELRPGPKRLIDAPAKTFWVQGAARMHYQGRQFERRDPTFAVNIVGENPSHWRDIDSRFRMALGMYDNEFAMYNQTGADVRRLDLRLLSDPVPWENGPWESGRDPHLYSASTLLINAAASQQFWYGPDIELEWELESGTSGGVNFDVENLGDVVVWPRWFVTAPGAWILPDYSWGQELAYQRPLLADVIRKVPVPVLLPGEDCDVWVDPDEEPYVAANGAPVWARAGGNGMLYPIAPHTKSTSVPVTVTGANPGAAVTLTIPRRYSRPLGVTL